MGSELASLLFFTVALGFVVGAILRLAVRAELARRTERPCRDCSS